MCDHQVEVVRCSGFYGNSNATFNQYEPRKPTCIIIRFGTYLCEVQTTAKKATHIPGMGPWCHCDRCCDKASRR